MLQPIFVASSASSSLLFSSLYADYEGVAAGKLGTESCYFISVQSSTKLKQILRIKRDAEAA